jgi:drug/metabolite transporter (DMT)-like permease
MSHARIIVLTVLALLAFAGNSLLCRAALSRTHIDAATFTSVRLVSGALMLWVLLKLRGGAGKGSWLSAFALFAYAAGFSFSYLHLSAAAGALILFGAVQATMIGHGLWKGERLGPARLAGLLLACAGLGGLLLPGLSAPPLASALLMLGAGVAWGIYSVRGKGAGDPLEVNAGNFWRAAALALATSVLLSSSASFDPAGLHYAVLSGALTSGIGYALWYAALPSLASTTAAALQLSVPMLAALGGVALLDEPVTVRLLAASAAILGGIALVVLAAPRKT